MVWVPVGAWCGAALLTAVVLGFCAYEIAWKAGRLRTDLRLLQGRADELAALRSRLSETQRRLAATGLR
jgi:hypothetical protein